MEYLFVCRSNFGRSQMAQGFFDYFHNPGHEAVSAGIMSREQDYEGRPVPIDIAKYMSELGIKLDFPRYHSKQLTSRMADSADRIIVMCPETGLLDFLQGNGKVEFWDIEDPYRQKPREIRKIRDHIGQRVKEIFPH